MEEKEEEAAAEEEGTAGALVTIDLDVHCWTCAARAKEREC